MPRKLKQLVIDRVDCVDKGAAPDAHILLYKRDDAADEGEGVEKRIARRGRKYGVLSEDGKTLGEHDTREAAVQQLRAVEASKHQRRGLKQAVTDALGKVLGWDDEVPDEALPEPDWLESLTKAGRKISAERLARLKEMAALLAAIVQEQEPEDTPPVTKATEGEHDMPTPDEFDAVMKRLEGLETKAAEAETLKKSLEETNAKLTQAEEKLTQAEDLAKSERNLRVNSEFFALAKRYGLNPDDDGLVLKSIAEKAPEEWPWVEKFIKAHAEQARTSHLFKMAGSGTYETLASSASEEAQRRAAQLVEKSTGLSEADAMSKVFRDDPDLYRRYRSESSVHGRVGSEE